MFAETEGAMHMDGGSRGHCALPDGCAPREKFVSAQYERFIILPAAWLRSTFFHPGHQAALFVVVSRDSIDPGCSRAMIFVNSNFWYYGCHVWFYSQCFTPGIAGLSISYAMQITRTLEFLVQAATDVEVSIVAVERYMQSLLTTLTTI